MNRFVSFLLIFAFCLVVTSGAMNVAMAGEAESENNAEYDMLYWQSVKDSDSIDMYRSYVEKFPQGMFVDLARIKIKTLEEKSKNPSVTGPANKTSTSHSPQRKQMLRSTPMRLEPDDLKKMLRKYKFHDWYLHYDGDFKNELRDNNNGTISDAATGLIWEKAGSYRKVNLKKAHAHIKDLNRRKFAGRSDWRMPTVEELASLIERKPAGRYGLYIDPIFDGKEGNWLGYCWTADTYRPTMGPSHTAWVVSFKKCGIKPAHWYDGGTWAGNFPILERNYVRAVCSVK